MMDEVRTGTYRRLFHPEQLISGKEDYTEKVVLFFSWKRNCGFMLGELHWFSVLWPVGGGTGSGLGSLLLERLSVYFSFSL